MDQQFYLGTPEPQMIVAFKTLLTVLNCCSLVLEMRVRLVDLTPDPAKLLSTWLTLGTGWLQMKGEKNKVLMHLKVHDVLILLLPLLPLGLCEGENKNLKGKKIPQVLILSFSTNIKLVTLIYAMNHYI